MTAADSYREYLAGTSLSAAAASMTITIAPRQALWLEIVATSFNVADLPALQFNSDSGTNYTNRFISYSASGVTPTDAQAGSATMAKLGANTSTKSQTIFVTLSNIGTSTKTGAVAFYAGSGAAATTEPLVFGGFEWINSTSVITTIKLLSVSGNNFGIGSSIRCTGGDYL